MIAFIAALAAIAGSGGLTNTPISNYTRDQGWGMGHHVGAIPSVFGGHGLSLSHVGRVFKVNEESLLRWRRWYRHVVRDQLVVWMPACFIGLALPAMLSVQFLPFGTQSDDWSMAVMTAGGVRNSVTLGSNAALGKVLLVHDNLLRLPRARADPVCDGGWRHSPVGRRLLDQQPAHASNGHSGNQVGVLQCVVGVCGLWTGYAFVEPGNAHHIRNDVLQHRARS
jgi:hypothetical protein